MAESGADFDELYQGSFNNNEANKEIKKGYAGVHSTGFQDFLLKPELNRAIAECGFEHPSEVQHKCIPTAVLGGDIICQAKSGMGKTAVFVLTVLQRIDPSDKHVSALVLCHTRELAFQIKNEFDRFSKHMSNIRTEAIYGGVKKSQHKEILSNGDVNIVVGTPGRTIDLVQDGALDLSLLNFFIMDECDKMLDNEKMRNDVQSIWSKAPIDKQVMMFTATLTDVIKERAKLYMNDPTEIYVDDEAKLTLHGLQQYYIEIDEKHKIQKLKDLLDSLDFNQVVIFVKSVARAKALNRTLVDSMFPSIAIHSGMPQASRISKYEEFKQFKARVLVTTDLCARGIDIERVNIVVNFDMPDSAHTYLHRVGRAGRFGTKGLAVTFVTTPDDHSILGDVQSRFEVKIPTMPDQIDASSYKNA
eukprot:gb/GECH01003452.1/.p1 GENE.gb/GECH01003452.1/~~gb/GECH01003452.1/.p1  ORF type:complete len:417 (+),score=66.28 gb/GECH01003452.1/:1-1251(+)